LTGYPGSELQLKQLTDLVWGKKTAPRALDRSSGKGRIVCGLSIREVLEKAKVPPDFAIQSKTENALVDFIHRRSEEAEIYFVANRRGSTLEADCTFRVSGKQPELWDPVTGVERDLPQFESKKGVTSIPLEFEPYGAMFVVFRKGIQKPIAGSRNGVNANFPRLTQTQELAGPWAVQFDPKWFYPTNGLSGNQANGLMVFEKLEDWNKRAEPAVRYFSGAAVYKKVFNLPPHVSGERFYLDLGAVKETARVRLNSKDLGVVWCPPWHVEITGAVESGDNNLEIEVINSWPNRLVGDKKLPAAQRRTRTHMFVGWLNGDELASGLLGPVTIQTVQMNH